MVVKIGHKVLMKETVIELKKKMMEWHQVNRVWIKNGDIDSVETSVFGWMLAAHDLMEFCPALKNRLTAPIKSLPTHVLNKAITHYGTPEDRVELP
jgi:hypothetical protein